MRGCRKRRGGALVIALLTLMVVMLMSGVMLRSLLTARRQAKYAAAAMQAAWLAEAALERGRLRALADAEYAGETWQVELPSDGDEPLAGAATIEVERTAGMPRQITARGAIGGITVTKVMSGE